MHRTVLATWLYVSVFFYNALMKKKKNKINLQEPPSFTLYMFNIGTKHRWILLVDFYNYLAKGRMAFTSRLIQLRTIKEQSINATKKKL